MPEIGTFGLMSGDGKRSDGHRPQATAPILDFTHRDILLRCNDLSAFGAMRTLACRLSEGIYEFMP